MSTIRLTIGSPAHGGHCVARHDGRVIFVRHTLPGEVVEAELTESADDATFWRADAVEILEASPDRVASVWAEAGPGGVGGGELAHVSLEGQRAWKFAVVKESFERFANQDFPGVVSAAPSDAERGGLGWRTRVGAIGDVEGRAAMHPFRSKSIATLTAMPLAVPAAEEALLNQRFPGGSKIQVVVPADGEARTLVDGVRWNGGRRDKRDNAPASVNERVTVDGQTYEYRVATGGFWQVHTDAPETMIREVLRRVGDAPAAWDLYAGAGLFSLALATAGKRVISVEEDETASKNARRNLHSFEGATVLNGDVRKTLSASLTDPALALGDDAAVVLDPPRSGAGKATIERIVDLNAARIVYVACDPVALARDTALLAERGYVLAGAEAFDLFPMTHHIEAIATFERS
ncbi:class I SAM-dependent RNA methyltransferase [Demequina oxidasica]|uniref:class I SAM-dependent RNA methyltransferase n=1 Tax=Demequina oxidasica TaxID=676199 RepID=UPI0007802D28|nr:TRAM domain-containing protein [Demequina oxidasica]